MKTVSSFSAASSLFAVLVCLPSIAMGEESETVELKTMEQMTEVERAFLAAEMEVAANEVGKKGGFFYDDKLPVHVKIKLDPSSNSVYIDLDERLGQNSDGAEAEDLTDSLRFALERYTNRINGTVTLRYTYGGKPMTFWYPEFEEPVIRRRVRRQVNAVPSLPVITISPGHGYYFNHGFKDWRPHREVVNGILEDDITPVMAKYLANELEWQGAKVHNLRDTQQIGLHQASGKSFHELGARYYVQAILPDHPEIWHSLPTSNRADRERREDLRSRPFYANYVKSNAFIHVHTNANEDVSVRGARVIYHPRAEDERLSRMILCGMKELIHSSKIYMDYPVPINPNPAENKGENRLAEMPSAIVEVGFHTNAEDARFLKEDEFQKLAMRGIAKGYRLYRENKTCADLAIDPTAPALARVGEDMFLPVKLSGNPTYPVRISYSVTNCATRFCHSRTVSLYNDKEVERHRVRYLCVREDLGREPIEIKVDARDYDGVKATSATYKVMCAR